MLNSKNKDFINIIKGIGILSIVIGHTSNFLTNYVYLFNLAIFFFVSGYLYKEEKYGDDPFLNFLSRFKTNYKKYLSFSIFFVLFHNIFYKLGMIIDTINYSKKDYILGIFNSMIFQVPEVLAGALWFILILIISSSIFGGIIFYSRKFNKKYKNIFIILTTILFGIIGVKLNMSDTNIMYHIQTVPLVIPIFVIAYYTNKLKYLNPYLKWYMFIFSLIFLYLCASKFSISIELANNLTAGYNFYLISIIGIYVCLYLSKIILKSKYIKKYFILIGNYSFEIMALHFLVFKIIDLIYGHIINDLNYGIFPHAYNISFIYIIFATLIPPLIMKLIDVLKKHLRLMK